MLNDTYRKKQTFWISNRLYLWYILKQIYKCIVKVQAWYVFNENNIIFIENKRTKCYRIRCEDFRNDLKTSIAHCAAWHNLLWHYSFFQEIDKHRFEFWGFVYQRIIEQSIEVQWNRSQQICFSGDNPHYIHYLFMFMMLN